MIKIFTVCVLLPLCFCAADECYATDGAKHKRMVKSKNQETQLSKVASADTTLYSIQMNGQSNEVTVNKELQTETSPCKSEKPNTIIVKGEGNTVSLSQTDKKSKVNISQNGNNNKISITQDISPTQE